MSLTDVGWRRARWAAGLFLVTCSVFARALTNGFVPFDDPDYVVRNPLVNGGLTGGALLAALRTLHSANWHPLTWASHMLDVELFDLDPRGHHATSVLLHAASAALLFLFLERETGTLRRSALAAALFALHPLRVESVAWISERKDVLSGLCFVLTLHAYGAWARRGAAWRYGLVVLALSFGLMAKSMLVTLPAVLLLLDLWPLRRWRGVGGPHPARRLLLEKLPLLVPCAAAGALVLASQRAFGSVRALEALPLPARLSNAVLACGTYLAQTFWPARLACIYPHPAVIGADVAGPTLAAGLGLAAATSLALACTRRAPALVVGWLLFLGMLVPVLGLVQVGNQGWADRYTYLPSIGLCIALVWGVGELVRRPPALARACVGLACLALALCALLSWRQIGTWRDGLTLFGHAARVVPSNYVAHANLGPILARAGRTEEAIAELEAALAIRPDHAEASSNLGGLLLARGEAGDLARALPLLERAVQGRPCYAEALFNLGLAHEQQGREDLARLRFEEALRCAPGLGPAALSLGRLLLRRGLPREALPHLERAAVASGDDDPALLADLAAAQAGAGDFAAAIRSQARAVEHAPPAARPGLLERLEDYRRRAAGAPARPDHDEH